MKIGLVLDSIDRHRGGAERYLGRLLEDLAGRGHEIHGYCIEGRAPDPRVVLHRVPVRSWTRGRREREFARRATQQARRDGCVVFGIRHVLDADLYQPHGGTWAASSERRLARSSWPAVQRAARWMSGKHRYFAYADGEVFRRNPGMITVAVSDMVRDDILRRYGGSAPRVETVWPAVDLDRFHPGVRELHGARLRRTKRPGDGAPVLLFAAHNFELKGLGALLPAFARTAARRAGGVLVVVGDGPVERFGRLARRAGVARQVRFEAPVAEMPVYYGGADVLVHPTFYDPCALVTLEALACGVPVVTSRYNGAAARVAETGAPLVEEPEDTPALAACIDAVLERREELSRESERVGRRQTWAAHLDRMERLFQEAAARG